jgi:hypothetical protein
MGIVNNISTGYIWDLRLWCVDESKVSAQIFDVLWLNSVKSFIAHPSSTSSNSYVN